jgi:hypothetical protein
VEPFLDHVQFLAVLLGPLPQPGQVEILAGQPGYVAGHDAVVLGPPMSAGFIVMTDPEGNEFCLD